MTDAPRVPAARPTPGADGPTGPVRVRVIGDAGSARDRAATAVDGDGVTLTAVGTWADCRPVRELRTRPPVDVAVVVAPLAAGVAAAVDRAVATRVALRVVVLSPPADIGPDVLLAALSAGADGWLTSDLPDAALRRSLIAVAAGEPGIARHHVTHLIAALRRFDQRSLVRPDGVTVELTGRESEVLAALAGAAGTRDVADRLSISESTVRWHLARLGRKLRLATRQQLVELATDLAAGTSTPYLAGRWPVPAVSGPADGTPGPGLPAPHGPQPAPVGPADAVAAGWASLTRSERRTVRLLALGLTNAEIAGRLVLSRHTVDTQVKRAFQKLGVHSRVELTRSAVTVEPELLHG